MSWEAGTQVDFSAPASPTATCHAPWHRDGLTLSSVDAHVEVAPQPARRSGHEPSGLR